MFEYNQELMDHTRPKVGLSEYVVSGESFQNWQSEFLSLAAVVVLQRARRRSATNR
jgi:hypothetical protein